MPKCRNQGCKHQPRILAFSCRPQKGQLRRRGWEWRAASLGCLLRLTNDGQPAYLSSLPSGRTSSHAFVCHPFLSVPAPFGLSNDRQLLAHRLDGVAECSLYAAVLWFGASFRRILEFSVDQRRRLNATRKYLLTCFHCGRQYISPAFWQPSPSS